MPITPSGSKININTAGTKQLTQLPGIAKNVVYRIVNHRSRHGFFTHWTELLEVKEFPADALDRIKQRATLECPPDIREGCMGPRRVKPAHLEEVKKKPKGYTPRPSAPPAARTASSRQPDPLRSHPSPLAFHLREATHCPDCFFGGGS